MNITHIRNATQIIHYAGKKISHRSVLADKGAAGFSGHRAQRTAQSAG